jgi:hypothetical protein
MTDLCLHCEEDTKKEECFEHCHESVDGKHVPNYQGTTISEIDVERMTLIVDVPCCRCGTTGSTSADIGEVSWG